MIIFMVRLLRDEFIVCAPCVFFHSVCSLMCVCRALFVLLLARCELGISLGARSPVQIQITSLIGVVIRPEQAGAQQQQQRGGRTLAISSRPNGINVVV